MRSFLQQHHRLIFYGVWVILGLVQSGFTELQDDEAYYRVYSKYLDWGYFDHPPMIAVLIKLGYAIFPNELGVRFFPLLLNLLSVVIIEKQLSNKNPFLFYSIVFSIAVLQLAGFLAVPDIPLIFFTALFFLCYKRLAEKQSWANGLLFGFSIVFLFYTKYHAVLIVLFTLLSNRKLLTKPAFYLGAFTALILYIPHLNWQWQHHWVSFRYHLFESNVDPYKLSNTTAFLAGQLLIAGPLAGFILLPAAFLYKTRNETERALKWTVTGIYIFFFLSSFRGKVEPNWTSPVLVPLIVLSHRYINERLSWKKWLVRLLPITILLVFIMRIVMIADILPIQAIKKRYHAWKVWPQQMKEKTNGLPVVFSNSYQRASKYWFYTGQTTYSQNHVRDHRNNYNFWPIEDELFIKPVYFLDIYDLDRFSDSLKTSIGTIGYRYDSSFISFAKVIIRSRFNKYILVKSSELTLYCSGHMSPDYWNYIKAHPEIKYNINLIILDKKRIIKAIPLQLKFSDLSPKSFVVRINPGLLPGKYDMRFSIDVPGYNPTHNSEKIKLIIR